MRLLRLRLDSCNLDLVASFLPLCLRVSRQKDLGLNQQ